MAPKVVEVIPQNDFTLVLSFSNGERREFDVRPYLDQGIFKELRDLGYFRRAKPFFGGVGWPHEQDFGPDTLYLESRVITDEVMAEGA